ncbi:membrane fusion protein (multidrug efflux system)/multidrug resistance protein K [Rahnella sp. JUb53]|uniref:HlyD family efflux transporter periplasmic adaptor subunit n=2 Tax=Rahnella TaxID=34037 RepID=UPI0010D35CD7|nr:MULTISPECIES: HlyD family efflux transporter periplasmic adaptor subunit [Rahnella]TCQ86898.1 membrane fusion protein (multidrug efflux system)/multidrug resistance protein K [Rahnella sp. JUb53]
MKIDFKNKKIVITSIIIMIITISLVTLAYRYLLLGNVQTTDDAYVAGNINPVSALINGSVITVNHTDTEFVKEGDVLAVLDDTDAQLAYKKSKHNLAYVVRQTQQLAFQNDQLEADVRQAKIAYSQAVTDYERQNGLSRDALIARMALEHYRNKVSSQKAALDAAIQQYKASKALLLDTPINEQPQVLQAADAVREAWITLQRTVIRSPVTGYIAERNVQVGQTVSAGQTLMSVIPVEQMWVNANFKETQLSGVSLGQKVTIISDIYGDEVPYEGHVTGINMGTGGSFSLLPAQNATGNWIKVVQRVPVRVALNPAQLLEHPLRIGLSTTAKLYSSGQNEVGDETLSKHVISTPALSSKALVVKTRGIESVITGIIARNGAQ